VRQPGRSERRPAQRSSSMPLRSGSIVVQGHRRTQLSDGSASGCRQENLRRGEEPAHRRADFSGVAGRSRSGPGHVGHVGPVLNATNPDLRSFRAEGGKLLQYHGWGDAASLPLAPSSITTACRHSSRSFLMPEALLAVRSRIFTGCSWCPEWDIAVVAPVPTVSMHSPHWKRGLREAPLPPS